MNETGWVRDTTFHEMYLCKKPSIPLAAIGDIALEEVLPSSSHPWVALPEGIRFPVLPFNSLVAFFKIHQKRLPWLYVDLRPIKSEYQIKTEQILQQNSKRDF